MKRIKGIRGLVAVFASFSVLTVQSMELGVSFFQGAPSFHCLVSAEKLDDMLSLDTDKLSLQFSDINHRQHGMTPLQRLICRSDARVEHIKVLFQCGADSDVPYIARLDERRWVQETTYRRGLQIHGVTPDEGITSQYVGNRDVMDYLLAAVVAKKILSLAKDKNICICEWNDETQCMEFFFESRLHRE